MRAQAHNHRPGRPLAGLLLLAVLAAGPVRADSRRAPLDEWFPRLRKGMWVKVEGRPQQDRSLRARELKVLGGEPDEVEMSCLILSIDPTARTLRTHYGLKVVVTAQTQIQRSKGRLASFSALQEGDRIEAEGLMQKDGTLLADEIEIKRPQGAKAAEEREDDEVTGRIESIDPAARRIVVLGVPVHLDEKTKNKTPLFD